VTATATAHAIGELRGEAPGPTLLVVGGLHGNEPAGVAACRRVLQRLRGDVHASAGITGEVVALQGNIAALAAGRRFLVRDLNRQWTPARLTAARAAARAGDPSADAEDALLVALADEIDGVLARARGPVFALDLHTTSAEGAAFAIVGGGDADLAFATGFALPGIVGMKETLDGVLSAYLGARGCVAVAIEGGQSESAAAAANLESVITIGLAAAGVLPPAAIPGWQEARDLLVRGRGDLPQLIEVALRHEVRPDRSFRMEPGFANIQRAAAGTLLAREDGAEIRAPFDGVLLLPLYQPQGSDGFFYGREVVTPRTS
jgi:succinylglutamate desuccinylase